MVAPVTGPFYDGRTYYLRNIVKYRYRQKKPYNLPLPYYYAENFGWDRLQSVDSSGGWYDSGEVKNATFDAQNLFAGRRYNACYNLAYERLRSEASDSAGWGENLAQAGQARKMFNDRASQLWSFTKKLSRRDFYGAARVLRTPVPSKVSHRKSVSQNFLEYHFGWEPIFNDISSSIRIMTSDPGYRKIMGSAKERVIEPYYFASSGPGPLDYSYETLTQMGNLRIKMGAYILVTNPNLFLANQLGLIDPALPWKLIPFSFVVDWFINVEQMISSMTDWFGCQLDRPFVTAFTTGQSARFTLSAQYNSGNQVWTYTSTRRQQSSVSCHRLTSITGPSLVVKPFKGLSITRGATAIALILSVLGK